MFQLGGNDPGQVCEVARLAGLAAYDEVNINCGCPSTETGGASYGAALMRDPALAANLAEAAAESLAAAGSEATVSVKCRLGVREAVSDDADDRYEELAAFVSALEGAGCVSHVVVHARRAVLAGLDPRGNREVPPLRHDLVHRLVEDFPGLQVSSDAPVAHPQYHILHIPDLLDTIRQMPSLIEPPFRLQVRNLIHQFSSLGASPHSSPSIQAGHKRS